MKKHIKIGTETVERVITKVLHYCDQCEKESSNLFVFTVMIRIESVYNDDDYDYLTSEFCSFDCFCKWWKGDSDERKRIDREKRLHYVDDVIFSKIGFDQLDALTDKEPA